jgi:hypothetical protein
MAKSGSLGVGGRQGNTGAPVRMVPGAHAPILSGISGAGAALLAGKRAVQGASIGAAGSALLGATKSGGVGGPGAAATSSPTTTTTTTGAPPVAPFLTAAQADALTKWNTTYGGDLAQLTQNDTDAWTTYNTGVKNDTLTNQKDVNLTSQSMAARGLAQSSIRQGALNDLAVTLATQLNVLQTNRNTTLSKDATSRETLGGENAAEQDMYWGPGGYAVQNAQSVQPDTTQSTVTSTTPGTSAPAPTHPSTTPAPGVSSTPTLTQPHTPSLAAAGAALTAKSAATRLTQPKPPAVKSTWSSPIKGAGAFNQLGNVAIGKVGAPK